MKNIVDFDMQPYFILEGGTGLDSTEEEILHSLKGKEVYVFDDLYTKPGKLACVNFLKPKTIIFGSTGLFKDKLAIIFDLSNELNFSSVENIVLTLEPNKTIMNFLLEMKKKYPKIVLFDYYGDLQITEL